MRRVRKSLSSVKPGHDNGDISGGSRLVEGWCPGALTPMASGDGLIVRVRPRLGRVSLVQLEALAEGAQRFGDGNLYLSNRANIQIRAVMPEAHAPLLEMLGAAGLIDSDPRAEAVRNVMLVPAFGAEAQFEAAAGLAARMEDILARTEALHSLPGKFGVAIQTGASIDAEAFSDITFLVQSARIAMLLDGDLGRAFGFGNAKAAADGCLRAALAFLKARSQDPEIRRMRIAVAKLGVDWFAREAGLSADSHKAGYENAAPPVGDLGEAFGMAFAFGEIGREALKAIAETMRAHGIGGAMVSPHRALILPCKGRDKAAMHELARGIGAITNPDDVRLRVYGCPGQPDCARATVPARRNAEEVIGALAAVQFPKGTIHISGCEKRCAYPHKAIVTAIGAEGFYTISGPGPRIRKNVAPKDLAAAVLDFARLP